MQVVFRVDASDRIGTGHVMRCLTLADLLRARGAECRFVHRLHPGHMTEAIRVRGYPVAELPPPAAQALNADADYSQWLGVTQSEDADQTSETLDGTSTDWLVVDHYSLDFSWEETLRPHTRYIAVIDDLANRHHDCDLLLDQNYIPDVTRRYDGLVSDDARRLCGPRYALLRPEYLAARDLIGPRRGPLSRILVFYGGSDVNNETGRALRVLSQPEFRHLAVDVVIGVNNRNRDTLVQQAERRPLTDIHGPREHLVDLTVEANLAIGAGGTNTWERCALGLPSIVTTLAQNQVPFNTALANDGLIHYLGHWSDATDDDLAEALRRFLASPGDLHDMARHVWHVVDGRGTLRVSESLYPGDQQDLALRPACRADKALYFEWANDPDTRRHARNPEPILWPDHDSWFEQRLKAADTCLWVLVTPDGLPVGQIRAEVHDREALLDYSIDPAFRGRIWETRLLELMIETWRNCHVDIPPGSEVRQRNETCRDAFLRTSRFEESSRHATPVGYSLTVLSDRDSWMNDWIPALLTSWVKAGHRVRWIHHPDNLVSGDLCFLLGCGQRVRVDLLQRNRNNLVVHESDLPKGRGWSPLTWQVLEGATRIPVTMLEAVENVDTGDIYLQEWFELEGHELIDELRARQMEVTLTLCHQFVMKYPEVLEQARKQTGDPTWYPHRTPRDSELDPEKSLVEQFDLFRVADNDRYPAFFRLNCHQYQMTITRKEP